MRTKKSTVIYWKSALFLIAIFMIATLSMAKPGLHKAAFQGRTDKIEALIAKGADINGRWSLDRTPLHEAARGGSKEAAALLIAKGAEVDARNAYEQTPLHYAAMEGHTKVAELLISKGAEVDAKGRPNRMVIDAMFIGETIVATTPQNCWDITPLHYAAYKGHRDTGELLISMGADVASRAAPFQATPLHFAAQQGQVEFARLLIASGADVNAKARFAVPFMRVQGRAVEADPAVDSAHISSQDEEWLKLETPLDFARDGMSRTDNDEVIKVLTALGAE